MSEEIKDIILDVKDSLNETPKNMYKYNKITLNLNEFEEILNYIEQLEKENIKQKEIIENLTTMTVCGDKKQIKNTAQYKLEELENIRKIAKDYAEKYFTKGIDSTKIFNYVGELEKENKILKGTILKALEFINNHTYRWKDTQFGEMVETEDFEPGLKPIELINILKNKFENEKENK